MRDFYPEDMRLRNCIFDAWRDASERSAFEPYDACVVESLGLLKRKAGEEIVDQIYHFKDKSNRDLALRPEMTPTLARMIVARQGALAFPVKWFTVAQCFRYERMTRGRKREHYQWNLDIIGEESVQSEAEICFTAIAAMQRLGLSEHHFRIHFNSRALLTELFAAIGISDQHHQAAFMALDKRGKVEDSVLVSLLRDEGCSEDVIESLFSLLTINSLDDARARLTTDSPAIAELENFLKAAEAYGISSFLQFDISVIRGLAYYTGIVFEAFDTQRELRAIFGGGRYDKLLSSIGGKPMTAVGLGFGDVVIAELLEIAGQTAALTADTPSEYTIGFMDPSCQSTAIMIAAALRRKQHSVDLSLSTTKPRPFFTKAPSKAAYAILIGTDDIQSGTIRIKELATRNETTHKINDLILSDGLDI